MQFFSHGPISFSVAPELVVTASILVSQSCPRHDQRKHLLQHLTQKIKALLLKLCRVTKVKVFFLVLVYVFHFDFFEFSAVILEKGLSSHCKERRGLWDEKQFRAAFYLYSKKKNFTWK